jgi:hypothetical protein
MVGQVNGGNGSSQRTLHNSGTRDVPTSHFSGSNLTRTSPHIEQAQRYNSIIADLARLPEKARNEKLNTLDLKPVDHGNILRNLDKMPDILFSNTKNTPDLSKDREFFKNTVDRSNDIGLSNIAKGLPATNEQAAADPMGVSATFGVDVARIAARSPSLSSDLQALEAAGWTISPQTGGGSYASSSTKSIVIDTNGASPEYIVQTIAHEVGHARYNGPTDTSSRAAYVDSRLSNEGAATLNNIKVQREILRNGGPDIGIAGQPANHAAYNAAYDSYLITGDVTAARAQIGAIFGNGETTSTTNQSYNDYYGSSYDRQYGP